MTEEVAESPSFDDMVAAVRDEQPKEEPKEEKAEETKEPVEAEEANEPDEEPADEQEPEEPKKKKESWGARERQAKLEERSRADAAERDALLAKEENRKLKEFLEKLTTPKEEAAPYEPLDLEADATYRKEINELKQEKADSDFQTNLKIESLAANSHLPDYSDAESYLIATEANRLISIEKSLGSDMTPEQAIIRASTTLLDDMKKAYKGGKSSTAYIYNRAKLAGFAPKGEKTEKSKVDMKAVNRAREEAGAPAIEKASAEAQKYNFESMVNDVRREKKLKTAG